MNRRRLFQTAAAALLAPAAARSLPAVAPIPPAGVESLRSLAAELPRGELARGTIRFATPGALSASGGICAPASPYYPLLELAADGNPIRDALTTRARA